MNVPNSVLNRWGKVQEGVGGSMGVGGGGGGGGGVQLLPAKSLQHVSNCTASQLSE